MSHAFTISSAIRGLYNRGRPGGVYAVTFNKLVCEWHFRKAMCAFRGGVWWPNLQPMQVAPSGGQNCN